LPLFVKREATTATFNLLIDGVVVDSVYFNFNLANVHTIMEILGANSYGLTGPIGLQGIQGPTGSIGPISTGPTGSQGIQG
jgi:hypothetical protein